MKNVLFSLAVLATTTATVVTYTAPAQANHSYADCSELDIDYDRAGDVVSRLYRGVLGRRADRGGYAHWVNALMNHPSCDGVTTLTYDFANEREAIRRVRQVGPARVANELARAFNYNDRHHLEQMIRQGDLGGAANAAVMSYLGYF